MARNFSGSGYVILNKTAESRYLSLITYSYYINRGTLSGAYRNIFWSGGSWPSNFHSFVQYDNPLNKFAFVVNFTGAQARWSIPLHTTGWKNHVITYDYNSASNDPVWYVDGVVQSLDENLSPSGSPRFSVDTLDMAIGAGLSGGYEWWIGSIAEFAIWNRILTADESKILAQKYSALFIPRGLVYYAPLVRPIYNIIGGTTGSATSTTIVDHPPIIYPRVSPGSWVNNITSTTNICDIIGSLGFVPFPR